MAKNGNLHAAKAAKNDEFYTQLTDIEKEMAHYREHFRGKTIFCNCDDPTWSNFWRYFHLNFGFLGLKKLIATHYDPAAPTYKLEYEGGTTTILKPAFGPTSCRTVISGLRSALSCSKNRTLW